MVKIPVRSERVGDEFNYDAVGVVDGLTVDGAPVYVEVLDGGGFRLVTVAKRGGHAHAVNTVPQTVADRPYGPMRIERNGATVTMAERAAAPHAVRNRCARFVATVRIGSLVMPDGSTVDAGSTVLALVVKNRDDSANATGTKRGSIVGKRLFGTEAEAVAWKHMSAGR